MNEENPLAPAARLLLGSLARAGVREVVISPGSRSTPWVFAALRTPNLRCHTIVDERSAGFFALGQARITGTPSLLLCTSGTAAAHYYPALIEARLSGTPLLVLTADRPFELQAARSPQTIDQIKLFGDHAEYFELGMPDAHPEALLFIRRLAFQAVYKSQLPGGLPVHLNVRARKPLEPTPAPRLLAMVEALETEAHPKHPIPKLSLTLPPRLLEAFVRGRVVIFSGAENPALASYGSLLSKLSERAKVPLLVDAASPLRFAGNTESPYVSEFAEWFLPSLPAACVPEAALHFGAPMVSSVSQATLKKWHNVVHFAVATGHFTDPTQRTIQLSSDPELLVKQLLEALPRTPPPGDYAERLLAYHDVVAHSLESAHQGEPFGEAEAARIIASRLPEGAVLFLGNSLPIRVFGAHVPRPTAKVAVVSQRGANGIDGLVSGAAGVASVAGKPTVLVLGDLSFLHDLGGLFSARSLEGPFVVVVLDNEGGRIFEQLPITELADLEPLELDPWLVPHDLQLAEVGGVFGTPTVTVFDAASLKAALESALNQRGSQLIVVKVDPSGARRVAAKVRAKLELEFASLRT